MVEYYKQRNQQILPGKCQKVADNTNVIHRKLLINVVCIYIYIYHVIEL